MISPVDYLDPGFGSEREREVGTAGKQRDERDRSIISS